MAGRLLLVDDDPFVLRALGRLLARDGYHITTVATLEDAERRLSEGPFDLMLLDVLLPGGDGFAFCRRMRLRHQMPILMLSACDSMADRVVGLEVGADD